MTDPAAANTVMGNEGFTLIEAVAALLIITLVVGGTLKIARDATAALSDARQRATALSIARSLLDEVGVTRALRSTDEQKVTQDGFRWKLSIGRYGSIDDQRAWPVDAYDVSVEIDWNTLTRTSRVKLSTIRLAPKGEVR